VCGGAPCLRLSCRCSGLPAIFPWSINVPVTVTVGGSASRSTSGHSIARTSFGRTPVAAKHSMKAGSSRCAPCRGPDRFRFAYALTAALMRVNSAGVAARRTVRREVSPKRAHQGAGGSF
jgi:hypothetical protein